MSENTNDQAQRKDLNSIPLFRTTSDPAGAAITAPAPPPAQNVAGTHLLAATGRRTPTSTPSTAAPAAPMQAPVSTASHRDDEVDWDLVSILRQAVSEDLTRATEATGGSLSDKDEQELARTHINEAVRDHVAQAVRAGGDRDAWSEKRRAAVAKAVFDSLFGLGRIQPLLEEEGIENLHILGHKKVFAFYADGRVERKTAVARSDGQLIDDIRFIANHINGMQNSRPFDAANPQLDLDLRGQARMSASYPVTVPWPVAIIRVHRFVDVTLEDMQTLGMLTHEAGLFLAAAVRASRRLLVSGAPGTGKTTFMRALANEIDPLEPIVTIEKEYELYLDRMGDGERHPLCIPKQWRRGQGETRADGTAAGSVTLDQIFEQALRENTRRIIVGEARGDEVGPMMEAFQTGVGGMTTIHAESAADTINRLSLLLKTRLGMSPGDSLEMIEQNIDLVIHLGIVTEKGRWRRVITAIAEVQNIEGRTAAKPIFQYDRRTNKLERTLNTPTPELLEQLITFGLDPLESLQIQGTPA